MEDTTYRRVVQLVDAALALESPQREAFLRRECADQPELRAEVDSLLLEDVGEDDPFLATPAAVEMGHAAASQEPAEATERPAPDVVGSYRVLEELGRGGMGTVYLAEQREPIERRVALKVLHGLEGERGTRRFAAECRALARLKHPNIAAVYDADVTDDHGAFVAMEWVEGAHITDWCDQHELSLAARIELFLGVCAGVGHAHQRGLVHRDLKPSNVLVAEVDGRAVAKVIDFGIARSLDESLPPSPADVVALLDSEDKEPSVEASRSLLMGSPIYMSPEAAALHDRTDVDTRTDVYSLGILLYELLVGVPPFDSAGLGVGGVLHRVRTEDPPSLNQRWRDLSGSKQQQLADLRGVRPGALARSLRGDLDAIVAKATARERDGRYGAVMELAADLRRHLEHRPVDAREPSLGYQLSRFVRRRAGAVVAGLALVGVLVAGVTARTLEARRANMEAERARQALVEAEQLSDFLIGLFEVVDPDRRADDPESVDELLVKAEERLEDELGEAPLAKARLLQTIGRVAMTRNDLDRAADLYEQSLALREIHQDPGHADFIRVVGSLGVIYRRQDRFDEAEAALVRATELLEASDAPDTGQHAATYTWLANLHYFQERYEKATLGHRRALEIRRQEVPPNEGAIGESLNNLSVALRALGRFAEAKPMLQEAETYFVKAMGPEHPLTVGCSFNMAGIEEQLGNWQEAERLLHVAADAWNEIYGPHHFRTLMARRAISALWIRWRRTDEAAAYLETLLQGQLAEASEDRLEVARTQSLLAEALWYEGELDGAERLVQQSLQTYSDLLGSEHYRADTARALLALVEWRRGNGEDAVRTVQGLVTKRQETLGESHAGVAFLQYRLGQILLEEERLDEAEAALQQALDTHESARVGPSNRVGTGLLWLGQLRLAQGRHDDAAQFLRRSVEIFEQVLPEGHPDLVAARDALNQAQE